MGMLLTQFLTALKQNLWWYFSPNFQSYLYNTIHFPYEIHFYILGTKITTDCSSALRDTPASNPKILHWKHHMSGQIYKIQLRRVLIQCSCFSSGRGHLWSLSWTQICDGFWDTWGVGVQGELYPWDFLDSHNQTSKELSQTNLNIKWRKRYTMFAESWLYSSLDRVVAPTQYIWMGPVRAHYRPISEHNSCSLSEVLF